MIEGLGRGGLACFAWLLAPCLSPAGQQRPDGHADHEQDEVVRLCICGGADGVR